MPFGLKNAGATYQRLVDKAFQKQIGRNLEVYVDDLVIKSRTEQEIMRDIEKPFRTLREINMKLNPKKCTFEVEEGMFLGYKSAEKSLPFFKALKKCTKKSDYGLRKLKLHTNEKANNRAANTNRTHGKRGTDCVPCGYMRSLEELNEKSINEVEVLAIVKEEGDIWITPIYKSLTEETLLAEKEKARAVRRKSRRYAVINGVLYKKSYLGPWLQCVGPLQANYALREIHEGSCSMYAGTRYVVAKAIRTGYYWLTMHADARKMIRECQDCQVHCPHHVPVAILQIGN
ncbi:reverse transcriptase domain-containing protein [Tanacetum coccineum]